MELWSRLRRVVLVGALGLLAAVAAVAAGCSADAAPPVGTTATPSASPGAATGSGPAGSSSGPTLESSPVEHVFIIVMENKPASAILGNADATFINRMARAWSLAADYSAVFHPSLPNYLALTSGSNHGISDDRSPEGNSVDVPNIADRIEASGRTWKLYGESMPEPGAWTDEDDYAARHIPFLYYSDVLGDEARLRSHVVPFSELTGDLKAADTTPDYAFITPDLVSDMHDGSIAEGDAWLADQVPRILASPAFAGSPSLLVLTWDEGSGQDNHVVTIFAGSAARRGHRSDHPYDHYSLLHTVEALWGLDPLTANDAGAAVMGDMLRN